MDSKDSGKEGSVTPEQFDKLRNDVGIVQRFIRKKFGEHFIGFYEDTHAKLTAQEKSKTKTKGSCTSTSTGAPLNHNISPDPDRKDVEAEVVSTKPAICRPPPPLLRAIVQPNGEVTILSGNTESGNDSGDGVMGECSVDGLKEDEEEYVEIIVVPGNAVSDEEASNSSTKAMRRNQRLDKKRSFSTAFEYGDLHEPEITFPVAVDSTMLNSEDDQGQSSLSQSQQNDTYEEGAEMNDREKFPHNTVFACGNENYETTDIRTKGGITFGTLFTAIDTGREYFHCTFCSGPRVFRLKKYLTEHYMLKHSDKPLPFQCQHCERRFLHESRLKKHELSHANEVHGGFWCSFCRKSFQRVEHLDEHLLQMHFSNKDFILPVNAGKKQQM